MQYEPFLPLKNLNKLNPILKASGKVFRGLTLVADQLERILGLNIGVSIPEIFIGKSTLETEALATLEKLRELNIVDSYRYNYRHFPDEPKSNIFSVKLTKKGRLGYGGTGINLFDKSKIIWPAAGEAVERWAWYWFLPLKRDVIDSSYEALKKDKLDIFSLAGLSKEQRRAGNENFILDFHEGHTFRWVKGFSLINKRETYIPLQLLTPTYVNEVVKDGKKEPLLQPIVSTGVAAAATLEEALARGVLEVIERDAFMIYWLNKIAPERIDLHSIPDERFVKVLNITKRYYLEIYLLYLKTDVPVHTILSVVIDRSGVGPAVMVGGSCGFDLTETAYHAINESLGVRNLVRTWWEDESLRNMRFPDTSKIGHKERILYWCHPKKIKDVNFLLHGKVKNFEEYPSFSLTSMTEKLEYLLEFFERNRYEVVYKEILDAEIRRKIDMTVAVVKIPAFQPLHLYETLPCFSGKRLSEIPLKLGVETSDSLNKDPHPFP